MTTSTEPTSLRRLLEELKYLRESQRTLVAERDGLEAQNAALVEALEKALLFMRNVPTDDQLDARLRNGVTGRDAVDAAELALAAAKEARS